MGIAVDRDRLAAAAPAADRFPSRSDVPYAGTIRLEVDATDLDHRLFRVREVVPVAAPGRSRCITRVGCQATTRRRGRFDLFAGLLIATETGQRLEWQRDTENMHAFHVDVPAGAAQLVLQFEFLTPVAGDWPRRVMTPDLLGLQWEKALLYPAGHYARQITIEPSIRLPAGWQYAIGAGVAQRDR